MVLTVSKPVKNQEILIAKDIDAETCNSVCFQDTLVLYDYCISVG